jgi:uncharacterized protein YciI
MYLMISKYVKSLDEVDGARDDHYAFLDGLEAQGLVLLAGRQDPPVGGVVLLDVDSEQRALEIFADDPYVTRGVAEYQAVGWNPGRGSLKDHLKA